MEEGKMRPGRADHSTAAGMALTMVSFTYKPVRNHVMVFRQSPEFLYN
jgi:hypothetical protein